MFRKLLLLGILCCLSTPVFATEADFEKRIARGVTALDNGNAALAQEEFRAALKEHPTDQEAALYLAIALNRSGSPDAESTLKNALIQEPGNPRINFELGTHYYARGLYDEAGDYFENLQALAPGPEITAAADGYLANIRSQGGGKRWSITVGGGMQYDSNVPLTNDGGQLPTGITRCGDWREVFSLGLTGVVYRDRQQELNAGYSLYHTTHLNLSEFNLNQHLFDFSYKGQISPSLWSRFGGTIESTSLGGNNFVKSYSVMPGLQTIFQEGMVTVLDIRFRDSTFSNSSLFPTNSERNGVSSAILLSHRQRLSDLLSLRLGYALERELTDVDAWSSLSQEGSAGLYVSLSNKLLLDISANVLGKKYDGIQAGATELRTDITLTGAVSLTWQAFEQVGVSVGYHYTNNFSNISGYDYTRGITSILFQGKY